MSPDQLEHILSEPALHHPPGVISNLSWKEHAHEQKWFYIVVTLCHCIPGIFLLLRLYTKIVVVRKLEFVDYLIGIGFILAITMTVLGRMVVEYGAGIHQWNISVRSFIKLSFWIHLGDIIYCPTIITVKLAIVIQYLQLLAPNRTVNGLMFFGSWAVIVITVIFYTIMFFTTVFQCYPQEKIWNPTVTGGKCPVDHAAHVVATAIFNIVSDFVILALPTTTVWRLRIRMAKKAGITMLFGTGLFACVATVMRIVYIMRVVEQGKSADISYNISWLGIWSYIEISFCLTVACALSLPKLLLVKKTGFSRVSSFFSRMFSSVSGSFNLSFRKKSSTGKGAIQTENIKGNGNIETSSIELVFLTKSAPAAKTLNQDFNNGNGNMV